MSRFTRHLLLICGGALLLRLIYVLVFKRDEPAIGDAIYYSAQAQVLSDGKGFVHPFAGGPAADHPPLTALAMTPIAFVFDGSLLAQRLGMVVLGVAVVYLVGLLGREVAGERAGLIAAGIAAVYPNLWLNDGVVMSETLATLLLVAVFLAIYRFRDDFTWGRMAIIGALCGLAILARAESALLLPLVVLPTLVWCGTGRWWARLGRVVVAGLVSLAVLAPWVIPNLVRFEEPVLLSSNDGLTLSGANCDTTYYGDGIGLWSLDCPFGVTGPDPETADQSELASAYRDAAVTYIENHKKRFPVVAAARVGRIWGVYAPGQMVEYSEGDLETSGEGREAGPAWVGYAFWWVLAPLAVVGAVLLRRRGVLVLPLVMTFVMVTVTAVLFYGLIRFRIPAEIAVVVLAAAAVDQLLRNRRSPSLEPS